MYGGNPNSSVKGPLSNHHLTQTTGTHNNMGAGGALPGALANQAPAPGLNLNSGVRTQMPGLSTSHYNGMISNYNQEISSLTRHGNRMAALRPTQFRHIDRMVGLTSAQIRAVNQAAAQQRREAELQKLLMQRDSQVAQQGAPRSGTHMFFGF